MPRFWVEWQQTWTIEADNEQEAIAAAQLMEPNDEVVTAWPWKGE